MADLAVLAAGAVTVPIYPTLSAAQARYILHDSGARLAIVSTRLQLEKIQEVRHQLPALEAVVLMDGLAASDSPSVISLDAVARARSRADDGRVGRGREFRDAARAVAPDHLATIIYTSGTTGEPKGVMLTHANLVSNVMAGARGARTCTEDDVALSFLPLSHAFERMVSLHLSAVAASRWSSPSRSTRSAATSARVRPTVLTGVPRVYEKLHGADPGEGAGRSRRLKGAIFSWAVGAGMARGEARAARRSPVGRCSVAAGGARRPAGVLEDPRGRRRAAFATSSRAARRCGAASPSSSTASACRSSRATA